MEAGACGEPRIRGSVCIIGVVLTADRSLISTGNFPAFADAVDDDDRTLNRFINRFIFGDDGSDCSLTNCSEEAVVMVLQLIRGDEQAVAAVGRLEPTLPLLMLRLKVDDARPS